MILHFCEWLAETPWSIALHESLYGYAIVESVHVWALCIFLSMAVLLDLRLVGLALSGPCRCRPSSGGSCPGPRRASR